VTPRLELGFRRRFRDLLALVRPRRLDFGVDLLVGRTRERSAQDGVPLARAFLDLYLFTRLRVARRLVVTGACTLAEAPWERFKGEAPAFLCDESLVGLGRWLRAAGYATRAASSSKGDVLLGEAASGGLVLATSDAELVERRVVRDGSVVVQWVPTGVTPTEQLGLVLADLGLRLRVPRCMACGGTLEAVAKDSLGERIPPRTARWKDDYWVCASCTRLFWQGTHWERIARALAQAAA
jgi:hypothetical protein